MIEAISSKEQIRNNQKKKRNSTNQLIRVFLSFCGTKWVHLVNIDSVKS
jgi:hypothetical protein